MMTDEDLRRDTEKGGRWHGEEEERDAGAEADEEWRWWREDGRGRGEEVSAGEKGLGARSCPSSRSVVVVPFFNLPTSLFTLSVFSLSLEQQKPKS